VDEVFELEVVCQKWLESERDWGIRPDGYSLHLNEDDLAAYVRDYWESMPQEVPDEYSRPDGTPYRCKVSPAVYEKVTNSHNGTRFYDTLPWPYGKDGWLPADAPALKHLKERADE